MHAETLAFTGGAEECQFLSLWWHELGHPLTSARGLLAIGPAVLPPIDGFTDCEDLYPVLQSPAQPTNKTLQLYLSALREDFSLKLLRSL